MLSLVKFPTEFPRAQKSLDELQYFKANEYRNFILYVGPIILKDILEPKYYTHFLAYATAIRLLTEDKVDADSIHKADLLMNYFVKRFGQLYSSDNVTYNLHAHLHLASIVKNNAPLHKISAFPFESCFKLFNSFLHGTRAYGNQICENMQVTQMIEDEIHSISDSMIDFQLKSFLLDLKFSSQRACQSSRAIKLDANERKLILAITKQRVDQLVFFDKIFINKTGI